MSRSEAQGAPGLGPPIALRLISLLLVGWSITLGVAVAIVLFLPPPPPASYRLSEIVAAFHGGPLSTRDGRQLTRARHAAPPKGGELRLTGSVYRLALATALGKPAERVLLERYATSDPVQRALLRVVLSASPPTVGPPGAYPGFAPALVGPRDRLVPPPEPPKAATGLAPEGVQLPLPPGPFKDLEAFPPLQGAFAAAVREPDGQWLVVASAPEPFPNAWQARVILWLAVSFGILAPIGFIFARRLTAPIGRFAQAAERLGRDPKAEAMELTGPAEIGRAAAAFNEMQERLKRYIEHRTAMIGAVAHDMRTPLARIRFKIEALEPEAKEAIKRDIVQMEQMISAALTFVREASESRPRELVDLGSVLECVVDSAALVGGDVKLAAGEPLVLQADVLSLERLFANLIDNAVKYGARARVKLRRLEREALIEVSDAGPGLPEAELERVFEPFYRLEPSRCQETGGMGLGLAVARSIARAHGGDIELANGRQGLVARVRLPLPPEDLGEAPMGRPARSPEPA